MECQNADAPVPEKSDPQTCAGALVSPAQRAAPAWATKLLKEVGAFRDGGDGGVEVEQVLQETALCGRPGLTLESRILLASKLISSGRVQRSAQITSSGAHVGLVSAMYDSSLSSQEHVAVAQALRFLVIMQPVYLHDIARMEPQAGQQRQEENSAPVTASQQPQCPVNGPMRELSPADMDTARFHSTGYHGFDSMMACGLVDALLVRLAVFTDFMDEMLSADVRRSQELEELRQGYCEVSKALCAILLSSQQARDGLLESKARNGVALLARAALFDEQTFKGQRRSEYRSRFSTLERNDMAFASAAALTDVVVAGCPTHSVSIIESSRTLDVFNRILCDPSREYAVNQLKLWVLNAFSVLCARNRARRLVKEHGCDDMLKYASRYASKSGDYDVAARAGLVAGRVTGHSVDSFGFLVPLPPSHLSDTNIDAEELTWQASAEQHEVSATVRRIALHRIIPDGFGMSAVSSNSPNAFSGAISADRTSRMWSPSIQAQSPSHVDAQQHTPLGRDDSDRSGRVGSLANLDISQIVAFRRSGVGGAAGGAVDTDTCAPMTPPRVARSVENATTPESPRGPWSPLKGLNLKCLPPVRAGAAAGAASPRQPPTPPPPPPLPAPVNAFAQQREVSLGQTRRRAAGIYSDEDGNELQTRESAAPAFVQFVNAFGQLVEAEDANKESLKQTTCSLSISKGQGEQSVRAGAGAHQVVCGLVGSSPSTAVTGPSWQHGEGTGGTARKDAKFWNKTIERNKKKDFPSSMLRASWWYWNSLQARNPHGKLHNVKNLRKTEVPRGLRAAVWELLLNVDHYLELGLYGDFDHLKCATLTDESKHAIEADITRTMPLHCLFWYGGARLGVNALRNILTAYAAYEPDVGYCQGMSSLAAIVLIHSGSERRAYVMFAELMRSLGFSELFKPGFPGLAKCLKELEVCVEFFLPKLNAHLQNIGVSISTFADKWYFTALAYNFPHRLLFRLWDTMLLEKSMKVITRAALAVLKLSSARLMDMEFEDALVYLQRDFAHPDSGVLSDTDEFIKAAYSFRFRRRDVELSLNLRKGLGIKPDHKPHR